METKYQSNIDKISMPKTRNRIKNLLSNKDGDNAIKYE